MQPIDMHKGFVENEGASGLYVRCIYSAFRHLFSNIQHEFFVAIYRYILVAVSNISDCYLSSVMTVRIF